MRARHLLLLTGLLASCDAPPRDVPAPPPTRVAAPAPPSVPAPEQLRQRIARCEQAARTAFRRGWAESRGAQFDAHYSVRLEACFLAVTDASQRWLYDASTGELYGEFTAAPGGGTDLPVACRVQALHCASAREWEVLTAEFLRD